MADAIIYKSQQIKSVEFRSMRVLLALLHTALRELRFLRAALACSHSRPGRRSEQVAPSHAMLSLRAAAAPCEAAPLLPGRPSRRHRGTTPVGRCGHRSLLHDCWSTAVPCSEPLRLHPCRLRSSRGHAAAPRACRPAAPSAARLLALASRHAPRGSWLALASFSALPPQLAPPRPPPRAAHRRPVRGRGLCPRRSARPQCGRSRTRCSRAPRARVSCSRNAEAGQVGDGLDRWVGTGLVWVGCWVG